MEYKEFVDKILAELKEYYGRDAEVSVDNILGNNGKRRDALCIRYTEKEEIMTPAIYLDHFFAMYLLGGEDFDHCVGKIIQMREAGEADCALSERIKGILDWDNVKDSVYPVLISASENEEFLTKYVHTAFLDLAVVYEVRVDHENGTVSSKISNGMLKLYGVSREELHSQALENMEKDSYQMEDILNLLENHDPMCVEKDISEVSENEYGKMYVLSNARRRWGAAVLLNQKFLKEHLGSRRYYILPSSIHEVIIVPATEEMDSRELSSIVEEINRSQVAPSEWLSNHCYVFEGASGKIESCA